MRVCAVPITVIFIQLLVNVFAEKCNVRSGSCHFQSGETSVPTSASTLTDSIIDQSKDKEHTRQLNQIEYREVVPETYTKHGSFQSLFQGRPIPISVETEIVRNGFIRVVLRGRNTYRYEISYNNADGWVNNVRVIDSTYPRGASEDLAAERRVNDIIANVNQIAFERDGRIQFIADNGSTRVSFDPSGWKPFGAFETHNHFPETYSTQYWERPGAVITREILPDTYIKHGSFQPLYGSRRFPITIQTEVVYEGFMKVYLRGINFCKFEISYDSAGGWVKNVRMRDCSIKGALASEDLAVEAKVRDVIANVNRIAFENDGGIQFITDHGSTRITFVPSRWNW